jgi:lauroyl/myristoyl acyltransferase
LYDEAIDNLKVASRGRLRSYLEYGAAWLTLKGVGLWPRPVALRIGEAVGALARWLLPHLRRHAEVNLRFAFPELSARGRQQILRGTFRNLGRLLGEVSQFPRLNRANISSVVVYDGLENFLAARDQGRGVILLTGHIGAWELSVFAHSIYGHPMSFLARRVTPRRKLPHALRQSQHRQARLVARGPQDAQGGRCDRHPRRPQHDARGRSLLRLLRGACLFDRRGRDARAADGRGCPARLSDP